MNAKTLEYQLGKAIADSLGRRKSRRLLDSPVLLHRLIGGAHAAANEPYAAQRIRLPRGDGANRPLPQTVSQRTLLELMADGDWAALWPDDELLTTDETAALIGKSQPTVLDWIKRDRIIGLTRKKRGFRVPKEQFSKKGELIAGVKEILTILPDHNTAWSFLTEPYPFDSGIARPLDFIEKGKAEEAVAAANSWGTDFS